MRLKDMVRSGVISILAAVAVMVPLECTMRVACSGARCADRSFYAGGNHPRFLFEPDPITGYRLRSSFRGRDANESFSVDVFINSQNLRDKERSLAYEPAGPVILGLGDSFAYGEGVALEDTYLSRLENAWREKSPGADVIKAGVPGFNSQQMARYAHHLVNAYHPQAVIAGIYYPDLSRDRDPFVYKEGFLARASAADTLTLAAGNLWHSPYQHPWLQWIQAQFMARSFLVRWAASADWQPMRADASEAPGRALELEVAPCQQSLLDLKSLCAAPECQLVILLIPEKDERWGREPSSGQVADALLKFCNGQGLKCLDLREALGRYGHQRARYYFSTDAHWSRDGHRQVADFIWNRK